MLSAAYVAKFDGYETWCVFKTNFYWFFVVIKRIILWLLGASSSFTAFLVCFAFFTFIVRDGPNEF